MQFEQVPFSALLPSSPISGTGRLTASITTQGDTLQQFISNALGQGAVTINHGILQHPNAFITTLLSPNPFANQSTLDFTQLKAQWNLKRQQFKTTTLNIQTNGQSLQGLWQYPTANNKQGS